MSENFTDEYGFQFVSIDVKDTIRKIRTLRNIHLNDNLSDEHIIEIALNNELMHLKDKYRDW